MPMIFTQSTYHIRCEWGIQGVRLLAPISDVIIIVDVLSFSTSVEIATSKGARIYPYRWKDLSAYQFARSVDAEVADQTNRNGYHLSPASLLSLPAGARLVLPSPNGSTLSLATNSTPTIAGGLRNARAVAESAGRKGKNIAVIPAGERWEDGTLRPCFEDLLGAGAIIHYLRGTLSPESEAAVAVYKNSCSDIVDRISGCGSGKEKIARGEEADIVLASELNISTCVPILAEGAYMQET
jgi:2-phosphosulfolactate phosphatase